MTGLSKKKLPSRINLGVDAGLADKFPELGGQIERLARSQAAPSGSTFTVAVTSFEDFARNGGSIELTVIIDAIPIVPGKPADFLRAHNHPFGSWLCSREFDTCSIMLWK